MPVSILILTHNEARNLPGVLASVAWADDIVVLDDDSTDGTAEIASEAGCRVVRRTFGGKDWAAHQNFAMTRIDYRHRWVFYLDADERMTPPLREEITKIAEDWEARRRSGEAGDPVAYYCGRRNYFRGGWLRHAMPPGTIMRFFQPPHIRFERLVNPTPVVDGPVGYLQEMFDHYNFSKGIAEWFHKHNNYSTSEALETIKSLDAGSPGVRGLLSGDRATRRQAVKELSYRLPGRPLLRFLYMYVLKRGFLDGGPGFDYCLLQAIYEYQIVLKVHEIRRQRRGLIGS